MNDKPRSPLSECDLVMKGGITSGIVFPKVIAKLSTEYRFKSIGGTSAGAIAATVAAAAEYGRQRALDGGQLKPGERWRGFSRIEGLPQELGEPVAKGRTKLISLFQPRPAGQLLFEIGLAALPRVVPGARDPTRGAPGLHGRWRDRLRHVVGVVLRYLPPAWLVLILLGFVLALLLALNAGPGLGSWIGVPICILAGFVGAAGLVLWRRETFRRVLVVMLRSRSLLLAWLLPTLLGFVLAVLIAVNAGPGLATWIGVPICIVAGLVGAAGVVVWCLAAMARDAFQQDYGLCPGLQQLGYDKSLQGLTEWLHGVIQDVAGKGQGPPLTFGDLWGVHKDNSEMDRADENEAPRDIELVLMTSNVTQGISHRLPFIERGSQQPLYFREDELKDLVPPDIMCWLKQFPNPRKPNLKGAVPDGYHRLPAPARLPLLLGARLSLSFPFLISAVPLYAAEEDDSTGQLRMKRCWFSDGGLTSNFPIHFFDAPLPCRPSFCINLQPATCRLGEQAGEPATNDPWSGVWMPCENEEGQIARFNDLEKKGQGKILPFLAALFDTARSWGDNELMLMPGYRDRIVHVRLREGEGGMNLDMPLEVIDCVAARGEKAAELLIARYAPGARGRPDPQPWTRRKIKLDWDNHRWVRYRSLMQALEDLARRFRRAWHESASAPGDWCPYNEFLASDARLKQYEPYPFADSAQQAHAREATQRFLDFAADWTELLTFDGVAEKKPDQNSNGVGEKLKGPPPRPRGRLRMMPTGDHDPRATRSFER